MNGPSALGFGAAVIVLIALTYGAGVAGCIVGGTLVMLGLVVTAIFSWADAAVLAVGGITGILLFSLAMRWALRHQGWKDRLLNDRDQSNERQLQMEGAAQQL